MALQFAKYQILIFRWIITESYDFKRDVAGLF